MSDGTNGEPSAPAPFTADQQTVVGLPDYDYIERKRARHQKLRALLQRRDPNGSSTNLWDINVRKTLGESRLSPEEMAVLRRQTKRPARRRRMEQVRHTHDIISFLLKG